MNIFDGRIVEIERNVSNITYVIQRVKKENQYKYANCPGGNGSFVVGGEYSGVSLNFKIFMFDNDIYGIPKIINIDLREYILKKNAWKNLTNTRIEEIINNNKGKKVKVIKSLNRWDLFEYSQLEV